MTKPSKNIAKKLKKAGVKVHAYSNDKPLWKGPELEGVSQSMLATFFTCRERFRVRFILGYDTQDRWNHRLGYGDFMHCCEEYASQSKNWLTPLQLLASEETRKWPMQKDEIAKWYNLAKIQFPIYLDYWSSTVRAQKVRSTEEIFNVPYELPSGRMVRLRGKMDGVIEDPEGLWLAEHKTKGDIDQEKVRQQLQFDLQTMVYLIAMRSLHGPSEGVKYNVIRRPLSGGRHSIRQKKGQTKEEFYAELAERIASEPEFFFMRWDSRVTAQEIGNFEQKCLIPILEELCDWYEIQCGNKPYVEHELARHWRTPYGIYNPMAEGRFSDIDDYLNKGETVGLRTLTTVFPELQEEPNGNSKKTTKSKRKTKKAKATKRS